MSEQEKKQRRIYDLLNAETKFLCLLYTKQKKKYFSEKRFLKKNGLLRIDQPKKAF